VSLLQGEVALLQVKSIPNMPVTFTSFDLGRFQESQLTTVTVESDDNGIAKASLESPKGTAGDINVLVASPVVTGQVKFLVNVSLPQAVLDHVE
jgi:hypothetical protein